MNAMLAFFAGVILTALAYELYRIRRVHRDTGLPIRWVGPMRARRELASTLALVRSGAMDYDAAWAQVQADIGTAVILWRMANVPLRLEEAALEWAAEELDRRTPEIQAELPIGCEVINVYRARLERVRAKIRRR